MRNLPPRKLINLSTAGQKKEGGMGQVAKQPNFPPFFYKLIPSFPMSTIVLGITKRKHFVQAVF